MVKRWEAYFRVVMADRLFTTFPFRIVGENPKSLILDVRCRGRDDKSGVLLPASTYIILPDNLTELNLHCLRLTFDEMSVLCNTIPKSLLTLNLGNDDIGSRDVITLLACDSLQNLTTLDLRNNRLSNVSELILPASLTDLDVSRNRLGPEGFDVLVKQLTVTKRLVKLTATEIHLNTICYVVQIDGHQYGRNRQQCDDAIRQFSETCDRLKNLDSLTDLNLASNRIGPEGVLCLSFPRNLTSLNVSDNHFGPEGALVLKFPEGLLTLNARGNDFCCRDTTYVPEGRNPLNFVPRRNPSNFVSEGLVQLSKHLPNSITDLDLSYNTIDVKGAVALCSNLPKNLKTFTMTDHSKRPTIFNTVHGRGYSCYNCDDGPVFPEGGSQLPEGLVKFDDPCGSYHTANLRLWVEINAKAIDLVKPVVLGTTGADRRSGRFEVLSNEALCFVISSSKLKTVLSISQTCRRFRDCALSDIVSKAKTNKSTIHSLFREYAYFVLRLDDVWFNNERDKDVAYSNALINDARRIMGYPPLDDTSSSGPGEVPGRTEGSHPGSNRRFSPEGRDT
jgi:hypothetical protein